jgi:hypothetical protein
VLATFQNFSKSDAEAIGNRDAAVTAILNELPVDVRIAYGVAPGIEGDISAKGTLKFYGSVFRGFDRVLRRLRGQRFGTAVEVNV